MKPKYEIGQRLWWPKFEHEEERVTCPDCGGTGRLRVTFHDETEVSIDCQNCAKGYEPPKGYLVIAVRVPRVQQVTVRGVELKDDETFEYRTTGSWCIPENKLFTRSEAAMAAAKQIAVVADQAERDKIQTKERDTRSWAWNATYHRREIKRAEKDLTHHKAKLAVADLKAKLEKKK